MDARLRWAGVHKNVKVIKRDNRGMKHAVTDKWMIIQFSNLELMYRRSTRTGELAQLQVRVQGHKVNIGICTTIANGQLHELQTWW